MKKYVVTIKEIEDVPHTERGSWTVIDKRPWTTHEMAEESGLHNTDRFLKDNPLKEVLGYAPDRETRKIVETELLRQTVETLDLAAVIKAVNGL
jgi:hypothetical protein